MRIALCQINPKVGDLRGNAALVVEYATRAHGEGARLAVFPELALCGYPPRDLLERRRFARDIEEHVQQLARQVPPDIAVLVGFVESKMGAFGRCLQNSAAVLEGGKVLAVARKRLLPTYDVFDEDRYFEPGDAALVVTIGDLRCGVTICEDIWNDVPLASSRLYAVNPIHDCLAAGANVIVNLSASPFTVPKRTERALMLSEVARHHQTPVIFVNQVGGNDELVFDGTSAVYGPDGSVWARARSFEPDLVVTELSPGGPTASAPETDDQAMLDALILGTRDYVRKCGFENVLIGLSGGIDSAVTACIATQALGKERVVGVAMPTRYSSQSSLEDATALAAALGIGFETIDIDSIFQHYLDALGPLLDAVRPPFADDVTFENVQSRIRCATLMAFSNHSGAMVLTTGNKSEIAVGYCTLYGDMAGGLAVISDVPKTGVYRLAADINRRAGFSLIPESTILKAPSAELRENQTDQDSLPPYEVLDPILAYYVEDGESAEQIVSRGFDETTVNRVLRLVRNAEYKRRQMAPGLIVTRKAFGMGRRYPVAQGYAD